MALAVAGAEIAGVVGAWFTAPAIQSGWYASLLKPEMAPPDWVFGPVWTILFALMGVAAFLVWSAYVQAAVDKRREIKIALSLFGIQLALNVLWSIIFFWITLAGWSDD